MTEVRSAVWVAGMPAGDSREDGFFAKVGEHFPRYNKSGPVILRIAVTCDLPGPYGMMERVRVIATDESVLWEGPLHNLEGVSYYG